MSGLPVISVFPFERRGFLPAESYALRRAKHYASEGEKIIDRAYFWHGFLGRWSGFMLNGLAAKLDRVTDEIEGFLALHEDQQRPTEQTVPTADTAQEAANAVYWTAGTTRTSGSITYGGGYPCA